MTGVYKLNEFMTSLENSFSKELNKFSIMIHYRKKEFYFEAKYLNWSLITYLYVKIKIKKEDFFDSEFQNMTNYNYCVIKNQPYFACCRASATDNLLLYLIEKDQ